MIRVLIVEDDFMVARVHSRYVGRQEGFIVVGTAHTGAGALRLAAELRPDLVILDIYLPDLSGLEILRSIRAQGLDTDAIVISAARDAGAVQEALRAGAVDYLVKPFLMERFVVALEHYRQYHREIGGAQELEQAEIDRLYELAARSKATGGGTPKGIDAATLARIEGVLRAAGRVLGADEVAAAAGVSRTTGQRYLRYLVTGGKVQVEPVYGSVGRPELLYRWALGFPPKDS